MNKGKRSIDRMNSYVVGIGLGEKESNSIEMAPDGEINEGFKFPMNTERYSEFRKKIPLETKIAFEASGSAYAVSRSLKDLGYNDITVAHPRELSRITKSKKQNDKVDSVKLSKLHLVGMSVSVNSTSIDIKEFSKFLVKDIIDEFRRRNSIVFRKFIVKYL